MHPIALLALLSTCLLAASADAEPVRLRFALHSEPVAVRDLDALRAAASPRTVRVFDPYEAREVAFEALPLDAVLDAIYSPSWRDNEELLLSCSDGYQPTVPVRRVLAHTAWLAFDRSDEPGFSIRKLESGSRRRIELTPFYLIWENLESPKLRVEGDYGWPYQLVAIDLIRSREKFPNMLPPANASSQARSGFASFRIHCSRCHAINGDGGQVGPELNGPSRPVQYRDPSWLERWIDDPSQMLPTARMPRLNPALPGRRQTIADIVVYLRTMSQAKTGMHTDPLDDAEGS